MKKQVAWWFLCIFSMMAFLPMFQHLFHPFKLAGLQGAFDKGVPPIFDSRSWIRGEYQLKSDYYLKNNTGFNGELVRLRNQVDYSFFGNINTNLTLGKEHYIFDPNYIFAREGSDAISDSMKTIKSDAIESVMNYLDSVNIPLLFCIAPNKANYYQEYLPHASMNIQNTNQVFFKELMQSNGAEVIDVDSWFLMLKDTIRYPLIPKYGAHWTTYGAMLAADSLIHQLNQTTQGGYASFKLQSVEVASKARFTDDDYLPSLNLMNKWKSPEYAYPKLNFVNGRKPNLLIISDSFIWNFYDLEIVQNCFAGESSVWYYNKTRFDISKNNLGPLTGMLRAEDLKNRDAIILISTGPSMKDFGFQFFEQFYSYLTHE